MKPTFYTYILQYYKNDLPIIPFRDSCLLEFMLFFGCLSIDKCWLFDSKLLHVGVLPLIFKHPLFLDSKSRKQFSTVQKQMACLFTVFENCFFCSEKQNKKQGKHRICFILFFFLLKNITKPKKH